ncbi:phage tail sheath C-terminal domain-containing protein [Azohydromonas caseinilytica]|uniref:Tail sheath protein C-terminal domain-containing protein n=1 Tax=Azohydromonas caseinilytica TaxID=2728836 RepID=A0A848FF94_9BURK|nr:phage tail sheath C-terminal domain-containing protein [Azohydromonas caseinilytica]NML16820.1 hypothetical protein [Azohydromonas caseinilytica]
MAQVSYPGVYIQEVSSGVRTITSVATSITAFVDFFREGPMNQAVEIFGMSDFTRVFGGLDARSEASHAIAQFFLNGGGHALVVRSHSDDDGGDAPASASAQVRGTSLAGDALLTLSAASEGRWGNTLRAEIDHLTDTPGTHFNLTITRHASNARSAPVLTQERFLNVTRDDANDPRYVVKVLEADSKLVRATDEKPGTAGVPAANGTTGGTLALTQAQLDALSENSLGVRVGTGAQFVAELAPWDANAVRTLGQLATRLQQALRTAKPAAGSAPTPPALTGARVDVTADARLVVRAGRDPDRGLQETVVFTNNGADTTATDLKLVAAAAAVNVQQYPLGVTDPATAGAAGYVVGDEGADGGPPTADALVGAVAEANDRGIYALRRVDLFNLLCIPRAAVLGADDDAQMRQVVEKAIAFCQSRRAFMLVDIPEAINEVAEVKDWLDAHGNFRSRNAALFFPRLRIADPLAEYRPRSRGNSGTLAGVFARTDAERGVWKAPAGIEATLRGIDDVDYRLTDAENGVLNPLAINALRVFPIYGLVSWGARTLDGADQAGSEWKYIPVRRLALMLEESLFRGTKWVVFEPNDEPLWARIRLNIGAYMNSLFRQGAFQGTTPKEAFFVKCDAETTTQDDRNQGIVNIEVGFAPLKPAEFVVIKIQQIAGDL